MTRLAHVPTATMAAMRFHRHGGPDALCAERIAVPVPHGDEVLVRVRALSLNGFDPMVLRGIPSLRTPLPMIPCADAAGEVAAAGPDVDAAAWPAGRRVSIVPLRPGAGMMGETCQGVAAEYCVVPATALLALPDGLDHRIAACLPTAAGTAFHMVRTRARVARGERVLVTGAAGGVGTACVRLAHAEGAEVVACARAPHASRLRALGAAHVIEDGDDDALAAALRRYGPPSIWGGGGLDVVIDLLGGGGWPRLVAALGRRGRLVTCGASAGADVALDLRHVWSYEIDIMGANGWTLDDQAAVLDLAARGALSPPIHAVRPLSALPEAMAELIDGRVFGKSVLEP